MRLAFRPFAKSHGLTLPALLALTLTLAAPGCTLVTDYRIADGAKTPRSYRTVAGSVHIGREAAIEHARTVAGSIHVDHGATTRSLSSVAGEIRIGEAVSVDGDVSTVAGGIRIDAGAHVTGEVSSIAGAIGLSGCRIDGPVRVTKGSLSTRGATLLPGGIIVRHTALKNDQPAPRIDIGPGADIASVNVAPETEVDLRISREAHVGKVTGTTATSY